MRFALIPLLLAGAIARADPPVFPLPPLTPAQTERIDAAVAAFPARDDRPHLFFLGFAGFGGEKVFSEEIQFAAREVGTKFGSASRTLLLINDQRHPDQWPMASHENLRYSLAAIGRVMNPERDVLFLALSSHGGSNGLLQVASWNLVDSGLGGKRIASWLDAAGIGRRIVVVSACYSGTFLEPLASNRTIVITASRHDRTSFGCSNDRDLTYFGEAFYRDSLPRVPTLRLAYERAAELVRIRESDTHVRRSMPQAYFGLLLESEIDALR